MEELPSEIATEKIIPYTYEPQPKELLDDIVSFNKIYFLLDEFYNDLYFSDKNSQYIHGKWLNEDARDELYSDIYKYIERNNKKDVWMRLFYYSGNGIFSQKYLPYLDFETQDDYYRYIYNYHDCEYNIKILLALLTTSERMELLIYLYEYWKSSDFWESERSRFFTWREKHREEYKKKIFKPIELYINDISNELS